jgi:hypothetical protein
VSHQPHTPATLPQTKELPVNIYKEPDWSLVIVIIVVILTLLLIVIIHTEATENRAV